MKTNLKTCPDSPWKRAFEKEVRESKIWFEQKWSPRLPFKEGLKEGYLAMIKEILGE